MKKIPVLFWDKAEIFMEFTCSQYISGIRFSLKVMDEIKNIKSLEKVYANLDKLIDNYADLPETEEAEKRFWEYAEKNIFQSKKNVKERELESVLYDVAHFNEKQGGFCLQCNDYVV